MIPPHVLRELRYIEISTCEDDPQPRGSVRTPAARAAPDSTSISTSPYRPGDDVRRIDWNVTARLNAPYVRQTHAERELDVVMALDLSQSMSHRFEPRTRRRRSLTFVAASLLFSAAADQINAGFLAFSDRVLGWTPPRRASGARLARARGDLGARARRRSHRAAAGHPSHAGPTPHDERHRNRLGFPHRRGAIRQRGVAHARRAARRRLRSSSKTPRTRRCPPGRGFMRVRDVETGAGSVIALNERTRGSYATAVASRRRSIKDACHRLGIDVVFVRTDAPAMEPLIELFARRKGA